MIDVIIPTKTCERLLPILTRCISSLRASEDFDFNVVLVESQACKVEVGQDMTILYDRPTFNYNHALKLGIDVTVGDWVVMANNDLVFHPGWFSAIRSVWETMPTVRSFCPWNGQDGYHNYVYADNPNRVIFGYRVCYEVGGWCLVCRRDVLETIDLSERVDFWYSDNVYADELQKHRIPHALIRDSRVDHLTSQTVDFSVYDSRVDLLKYRGEM